MEFLLYLTVNLYLFIHSFIHSKPPRETGMPSRESWESTGRRCRDLLQEPQNAEFYMILNSCLWSIIQQELNPCKSHWFAFLNLCWSYWVTCFESTEICKRNSTRGRCPNSLHICWLMLIYFVHVLKRISKVSLLRWCVSANRLTSQMLFKSKTLRSRFKCSVSCLTLYTHSPLHFTFCFSELISFCVN